MKYIPTGVTRTVSRALLKLDKNSPTILVVAGVVGLGATAVVAAKATRNLDPVLDDHKQKRAEIGYNVETRTQQKAVLSLYMHTGVEFGKVYAPAIALGTISAAFDPLRPQDPARSARRHAGGLLRPHGAVPVLPWTRRQDAR